MENKTDVLIIGAGPAGLSCAITLAKAGKEVIVIERGKYPGSKNMFGGAVYTKTVQRIFPEFLEECPIERINSSHSYVLLDEKSSTSFTYNDFSNDNSNVTVKRPLFDRWLAKKAKEQGAKIINETLVTDVIFENKKIIGIQTELENYYASIVVIADGTNSILAQKANLQEELKSKDVALGVKEVYELDKETIEKRFNLKDKEGKIISFLGSPFNEMFAMGYMFINQKSVSLGFGASLDDIKEKQITPYDLLENLKSHPYVAPLIEGGNLLEYSAHLIPEGGLKKVPKLYTNGAMVIGDAAMLINNIHWEGTNFAMTSGEIAGKVAIDALEKKDYSVDELKNYEIKLKESFVYKDIQAYRSVVQTFEKNSSAFLGFYPRKINEFFKTFLSADEIPKRQKFRELISSSIKERNLLKIFSDLVKIAKLIKEVLIK